MNQDVGLIKIIAPVEGIDLCFIHMSIKPLHLIDKIIKYMRVVRKNNLTYCTSRYSEDIGHVCIKSYYRDWTCEVERSKSKIQAFTDLFEGKDLCVGDRLIEEIIWDLKSFPISERPTNIISENDFGSKEISVTTNNEVYAQK